MGTVYKKTATKPIPKGAELFTKNGKRFARWKPSTGKARTAPPHPPSPFPTRPAGPAARWTAPAAAR